jgi:hypothetical protein
MARTEKYSVMLVFGSLLMTGCLSDNRGYADNLGPDPLRGGVPVQAAGRDRPPPGGPAPGAPAAPAAAAGPTPAAPASTTSPAALASGSFSPLDPNRSLQIGGSPPARPTGTSEWKGSGPADVKPERPEPPPPTARGALPSFGFLGGSRVATYEQAQSLLAARRVSWQRLETWGDEGEWKFSCRIPNPHIARTYEARAREPIAALRAVLEQIDQEQR